MAIYTMAMLVITRGYNLHFPTVFLWFSYGFSMAQTAPGPAQPLPSRHPPRAVTPVGWVRR